ncbi:MAG: RHS repeat-associated core domain-containing protein, partial [Candidatus Hermodarchaeota archaeon]
IYANGQVLSRHDGDYSAPRYFYIHDRLGSVRQIIDSSSNVKNHYIYEPFGELLDSETQETISNPFKFTGQYYDSEINQYYLRARQYDPHIYRFTSRDPILGQYKEPLTLHRYLYCLSNPVNRTDLTGEYTVLIGGSVTGTLALPYGVGGTFGSATFIGVGDEGVFWGTLIFVAFGLSVGSPGGALTFDVAFSNAERPEDLEGPYTELGGSFGMGAPVPGFGYFSAGASFAWNDETGVWIFTPISWGVGGQGPEIHGYRGIAKVWEAGYI